MQHFLAISLLFFTLIGTFPARMFAKGREPMGGTSPANTIAMQEPSPTPTPDTTPTPTPDPELERANREKALAEVQKAKAQAEKEAAEARKAAAEFEKAEIETKQAADKARLGIGAVTPSATAPSGNITGDVNKFIETQLLAELGARKASQQLVINLCSSKGAALNTNPINTLVVNNGTDKAAIDNYQAILTQLNFFHDEYDRLIDDAVKAQNLPEAAPTPDPNEPQQEFAPGVLPLIVPAATQAVKNFADLVNLFRTETEFHDQQVSVDSRMIMTFLASDLLAVDAGPCRIKEIYNPAVYPLRISEDAQNGDIMVAYTTVMQDISRGDGAVADNAEKIAQVTQLVEKKDAEIAELKKQIEEHSKKDTAQPAGKNGAGEASEQGKKKNKGNRQAKKEGPPSFDLKEAKQKLAQAQADKIVLNTKIDRLKRTAANIEAFKASITDALKLMTAVNSANNQTVLASLLRAERLKQILAKPNTYALDLSVRASGTNRIRRNILFNARIAHSGGVSISANLFNNLDQMVFGRQEEYYIEFTGSGNIRKGAGFQKLDSTFRGQ